MVSEAANLLRLSGPPARLNILRPRDPAVTDPLASGREVILSKARSRRSTGKVPDTVACMAKHALAFLKGFKLTSCDVHAFSLGGMVARKMVEDQPSVFRRMILVGTAPRGGEDIVHLEKPSLAKPLGDPKLQGYAVLQKIFFAPTESSQKAGAAFRQAEPTHGGSGDWLRANSRPSPNCSLSRLREIYRSALCEPQ